MCQWYRWGQWTHSCRQWFREGNSEYHPWRSTPRSQGGGGVSDLRSGSEARRASVQRRRHAASLHLALQSEALTVAQTERSSEQGRSEPLASRAQRLRRSHARPCALTVPRRSFAAHVELPDDAACSALSGMRDLRLAISLFSGEGRMGSNRLRVAASLSSRSRSIGPLAASSRVRSAFRSAMILAAIPAGSARLASGPVARASRTLKDAER